MNTQDSGQHFDTRARAEKKSLTFFREAGRGKALVQINNVAKFNPGLILLMGDVGSGRSRVLKQYMDSLKGKTGKVCVIDRAVKNEDQLYSALAEGFALDLLPGDSLQSLQQDVHAYLEKNAVAQNPVIIALDEARLCSLAILETLIALRAKFKQMSLLLVGDDGLEKMIQRLLDGKATTHVVLLAPLDAREVRQYLNWRLPFQLSDIELSNLANVTQGNLELLEQEAQKKELHHQQNALQPDRRWFGNTNTRRQSLVRFLMVIVAGGAGAGYFLYQQEANDFITQKIKSFENTSAEIDPVFDLQIRSNEEWVEQQIIFLKKRRP